MLYPRTVVAGCGNPLFADDGFGPAAAEELKKVPLPPGVKVVDAGICGTYYIFSLVDAGKTRRLIILDSVDFGSEPGSIGFFKVDDLPAGSYCDPFVWDIASPFDRIKDGIDILIIGCQPQRVSYPEVEYGLSDAVRNAIPRAVEIVQHVISTDAGLPEGDFMSEMKRELRRSLPIPASIRKQSF
ncbi:MAG: coenzyme F420-reducing hydrogenase, FrhD protein [Methanolinea sp.]|nr:coenzyme F420-reducing hydrogenase, FrhD protein [Methanolinea sp.]